MLVHGAYGGGWIWRTCHRLARPGAPGLHADPDRLGERSHLLSRQITVDTHIEDVANLITFEDLRDVILVGHSYGGMAVTGVADRLTDRIRHVVYLDALIPENGDTAFTILPAGMADARRKTVMEQGAGVALPVPGPRPSRSRRVRPRTGSTSACGRTRSAPTRARCGSRNPPVPACR